MQSNKALENFVLQMLRTNLPHYFYYHDAGHTLYVMLKCKEIGVAEKCSDQELYLLHAAALWHDTGYLYTYHQHEEESCKLARKSLPAFGYSNEEIEVICGMILATKIPQSPKNKLEEILADADLEYLATPQAEFFAQKLYKELHHRHPSLTPMQWDAKQITFLQVHTYFTNYCTNNKAHQKDKYLQNLLAQRV